MASKGPEAMIHRDTQYHQNLGFQASTASKRPKMMIHRDT